MYGGPRNLYTEHIYMRKRSSETHRGSPRQEGREKNRQERASELLSEIRKKTDELEEILTGQEKQSAEDIERFPRMKMIREYDTIAEYREVFEKEGYRMGMYADSMLSNAEEIPKNAENELSFLRITAKDLGLGESNADEILKAAKGRGLESCPLWFVLQYRINCEDDDFTVFGMEPIPGSDGDRAIFDVNSGGDDLWLRSFRAHHVWHPDVEWVFVDRK